MPSCHVLRWLYTRLRFVCCASRRRHTRWPRDWSSDVCSSDLIAERLGTYRENDVTGLLEDFDSNGNNLIEYDWGAMTGNDRSEERRVGEERKRRESTGTYKMQAGVRTGRKAKAMRGE